jgi:hypothetical protein
VQVFYLNKGYVRARVGQPQIETVSTSKDGKTRWIRLRIPVDEGMRYNIGKFDIADNTALRLRVPSRAVQDQGRRRLQLHRRSARASKRRETPMAPSGSGRRRPTSTWPPAAST